MIVCVLIPAFLTTVERQANPALGQQPCVIQAIAGRHRYVYALCAQSLGAGVIPGMPLRQAQVLSPDLCVVPANPPRYRQALDQLVETLFLLSDRIEVDGLPRFGKTWRRRGLSVESPAFYALSYVDLGLVQPSEAQEIVRQLQQQLQTYQHMQAQIGLAENKFAAYVAGRTARAGEVRSVRRGDEARFLSRRPVRLLPLNAETARRLRLFGIDTLGAFAALPPGAVLAQFGKPGRLLHRLARGEDDRPVLPLQKRREETARQPFDDPLGDEYMLLTVIERLAVCLAGRLEAQASGARALRLVLILWDGGGQEIDVMLRRPTADPTHIAACAGQLLRRLPIRQDVAQVELSALDITTVAQRQLALFPDDAHEEQSDRALEHLIARFGERCFFRAAVVNGAASVPAQRFELETVA